MSFISIIIPVYNVEAYLEECVESVLAQTFKDVEILLIVSIRRNAPFTL